MTPIQATAVAIRRGKLQQLALLSWDFLVERLRLRQDFSVRLADASEPATSYVLFSGSHLRLAAAETLNLNQSCCLSTKVHRDELRAYLSWLDSFSRLEQ